jgi:hypothetical protein
MQDITISRATIKEIAQRIYDNVDAYDYQDNGYSMKDVLMAVASTLEDVVNRITFSFEDYALGACVMYGSSWEFRPRRHCDATGCEMLVRSDNDIWCQHHGEIEDKRQAEVEAAMATQFDLAF